MDMRKIFIGVITVIIAAVVVAGVFMFRTDTGTDNGLSAEEIAWLKGVGGDAAFPHASSGSGADADTTRGAGGGDTMQSSGDANTKIEAGAGSAVAGSERQFQHPRLGFILDLPDGFSAGKFEEEDSGAAGETTLVQGPDNAELQIYATAFDEEGPLTAERIHKDLPTLSIVAPQQVVLHGGMDALVFVSDNEALGKTQEVWFVHDSFLYQMTTRAPLIKTIAQVIGSMRF